MSPTPQPPLLFLFFKPPLCSLAVLGYTPSFFPAAFFAPVPFSSLSDSLRYKKVFPSLFFLFSLFFLPFAFPSPLHLSSFNNHRVVLLPTLLASLLYYLLAFTISSSTICYHSHGSPTYLSSSTLFSFTLYKHTQKELAGFTYPVAGKWSLLSSPFRVPFVAIARTFYPRGSLAPPRCFTLLHARLNR